MFDLPGTSHDAALLDEPAWAAAPPLARLTRWLLAGDPPVATVRARAAETLTLHAASLAPALVGLLHLAAGDAREAARLLANAPGSGWQDEAHAGPVLFPALVWMVDGTRQVLADLGEPPWQAPPIRGCGRWRCRARTSSGHLRSPLILEVLDRSAARERIQAEDITAVIGALRSAAAAHVEAVLRLRQPGDYRRAATLIVACANTGPDDHARRAWAAEMERRTASFPAFRTALRRAFARSRGGDDFTAAG